LLLPGYGTRSRYSQDKKVNEKILDGTEPWQEDRMRCSIILRNTR